MRMSLFRCPASSYLGATMTGDPTRAVIPAAGKKVVDIGRVMAWIALSSALTGCISFGRGGHDEAGAPEPGVVVFGGEYERGPVVQDYAHRGEASRRSGEF